MTMSELRAKSPTVYRIFVLVTGALASLPSVATAGGAPLTAEGAVRRALERPDVAALFEARRRHVVTEAAEATTWPTPTLSLGHEQLWFGRRAGEIEATLGVEQTFDPSGWRDRLDDALPHKVSALAAEARAWRLDVATSVRAAYFEVRYRQARAQAFEPWIAKLESAVAALRIRLERGDAASYELRRVRRDLHLAELQRAHERAQLAAAWTELRELVRWSERPTLADTLLPEAAATAPDRDLPELERLEQVSAALGAESAAWGTPFLRGWTVGAAYRLGHADAGLGHGFALTLSVPLTLWNNDEPRLARLRAQRAFVEGELGMKRGRFERAQDAARRRLEACLELVRRSATSADAELTRLAERAYGAGESPLSELLDVYESETQLQLAQIDLQWEARRASLALDRSRGLGVPR